MKQKLLLAGILAVVGLIFTRAQACNIYLPPNSPWTDDEILVYGDGAPVYSTLGELNRDREYHGLPSAKAPRTLVARISDEFSLAWSGTIEPLAAQVTPVPEPGAPALLVVALAVISWRRSGRWARRPPGF